MNPIVGVGELLWDVYPDGRKVAGGAPFNFAFHCQQLGHPAVIVSRVGDDELGRELRDEVRRLGLSDEYVQTDPDHPTGTVRVTVDATGQPAYEIVENVAWDYIEWEERLGDLSRASRAVCFGMLAQRQSTSANTIRRIADDAPMTVFDVNYRPTVEDPWTIAEEWGKRCTWFKASIEDINTAAFVSDIWSPSNGRPRTYPPSPLGYFFSPVSDQHRLGILTLGPKGCDVVDWQRIHHERGVEANVVDTVGAGDAFLAAFLCSHLEGRPLKQSMRFALHYSARVCELPGATPIIDRDEIEIRLLDDPWMRGQ